MRIFSQRSVLQKGFLAIALFFVVAGGVMGGGEVWGVLPEDAAPKPQPIDPYTNPSVDANPSGGVWGINIQQKLEDQIKKTGENIQRNTQGIQGRAGEVIQDVQEKGIAALGGSHCDQYNGKTKAGGIIPDCDLEHCNYTLDAFLLLAINIIKWILGITGSLALAMFVLGGVQWLLSRGASGEVEKGLNTMINAVIGLAIIFGSWMAVNFIMSTVATAGKGATDEAGKAGNNLMVRLTQGTQKWSDISAVTCIPFTQVQLSTESYDFEAAPQRTATSAPSEFATTTTQQTTQNTLWGDCENQCRIKDENGAVQGGSSFIKKFGDVTQVSLASLSSADQSSALRKFSDDVKTKYGDLSKAKQSCTCMSQTEIPNSFDPSGLACGQIRELGTQAWRGFKCDIGVTQNGKDFSNQIGKWHDTAVGAFSYYDVQTKHYPPGQNVNGTLLGKGDWIDGRSVCAFLKDTSSLAESKTLPPAGGELVKSGETWKKVPGISYCTFSVYCCKRDGTMVPTPKTYAGDTVPINICYSAAMGQNIDADYCSLPCGDSNNKCIDVKAR